MITLRLANAEDAEVLKYWDTQPHVMDSDPDDAWNWDSELTREPFWRKQIIAEWQGKPVGFMQIIDPKHEDTHYWGEIGEGYRAIDIWIGLAENIGKGFGTQMMTQALKMCFEEEGVREVLIDPLVSNVKAIRFYQKLGFIPVEKKYFGDDYCWVMSINAENWSKRLDWEPSDI
ncbi:MAG: acetyltransferase [Saprospiraceae bacterium]|nr:acetyltransferase [Saprospiraceae bacterium]